MAGTSSTFIQTAFKDFSKRLFKSAKTFYSLKILYALANRTLNNQAKDFVVSETEPGKCFGSSGVYLLNKNLKTFIIIEFSQINVERCVALINLITLDGY